MTSVITSALIAGQLALTPCQQSTVQRAREALGEERHAYDPESMAGQIGRLQWALGEMLALLDQLTAEAPGAEPASPGRPG